MCIPLGFSGVDKNRVCELKRALYGLKQSSSAWFGLFAKEMIASGYKQSQGDHMLFIKHSASRGVTILTMYVEDIIVRGSHEVEEALEQCLAKEFEIKDLRR